MFGVLHAAYYIPESFPVDCIVIFHYFIVIHIPGNRGSNGNVDVIPNSYLMVKGYIWAYPYIVSNKCGFANNYSGADQTPFSDNRALSDTVKVIKFCLFTNFCIPFKECAVNLVICMDVNLSVEMHTPCRPEKGSVYRLS